MEFFVFMNIVALDDLILIAKYAAIFAIRLAQSLLKNIQGFETARPPLAREDRAYLQIFPDNIL